MEERNPLRQLRSSKAKLPILLRGLIALFQRLRLVRMRFIKLWLWLDELV